jgi:hypothetical protein
MVVVDHCALFIYLDVGYPSSFHDVTIMLKLYLYKNQWYFFVHINEYYEYSIGTHVT